MSECTHDEKQKACELGICNSTPHAMTREQVEQMLDDFQAFHDCEEACNHDLKKLSAHDAAQRQDAARLREAAQNLTCEVCKLDMQKALKGA